MLKIKPGRPKKDGPLVKVTSIGVPEDVLDEMHRSAEFLDLNFSQFVVFLFGFWKEAIRRDRP